MRFKGAFRRESAHVMQQSLYQTCQSDRHISHIDEGRKEKSLSTFLHQAVRNHSQIIGHV